MGSLVLNDISLYSGPLRARKVAPDVSVIDQLIRVIYNVHFAVVALQILPSLTPHRVSCSCGCCGSFFRSYKACFTPQTFLVFIKKGCMCEHKQCPDFTLPAP